MALPCGPCEIVAVKAMAILDVTEDRLDGGAAIASRA
jgi:hypothetical protein